MRHVHTPARHDHAHPMHPKHLHVFACRSNPLGWEAPEGLAVRFARHMVESGVTFHLIECAFGDRPFLHTGLPCVHHIGVRARSMIWNKENLLNLAVQRVPEARYIAWIDADVMFRNSDWASDTLNAMQLKDVVQPWSSAYDLGPDGEHMAVHKSFTAVYADGGPLVPEGKKFWQGDGGPYQYPHSGYAWACTRPAFAATGGLLDIGGMGSGDHHMALALVGKAEISMPHGTHESYRRHVMRWQERALLAIRGNIGPVPGTIEHGFHGSKKSRNYIGRWEMFVQHAFDPDEDLVRNADGVWELTEKKPGLRRDFERYLRARCEDANSL